MARASKFKPVSVLSFIKISVVFIFWGCWVMGYTQNIRIEETKNNFSKQQWLKVNGGLSLSSIYYMGNVSSQRDPFNYFVAGNVNFRLFNTVNVPLSINLTNSGSNFTYPTLPNRFSLHPSYKWATVHLGDISMVFSPYTLSDHQFTGVGLELSPGRWKVAAMYGRMQRKVEYDSTNTAVLAAYKRMGVGAKLRYDHDVFSIGSSVFLAKDDEHSLSYTPDSLGIYPQQNIASQLEMTVNLSGNFRLMGEYAFSLLERDLRIADGASVVFYQAYNVGLSYRFLKNDIAIKYERIDPQYTTLGTYYSNNDYENITLNFATFLLKDKLNLSANVGMQNDDLDNTKESRTERFVGAIAVTYNPVKQLSVNANYSNFQTYKNVKSQFDYINQYSVVQNLDTLDFLQLSQNATLGVTYQLQQTETQAQSLQLNTTWQTAKDTYEGVSQPTNDMTMINASVLHSIQQLKKGVGLNSSFNITHNSMEDSRTLMFGPTLALSARFLNKTIQSGLSSSCNWSYTNDVYEQFITNFRLYGGYTLLKKHTFNVSGIYQYQCKQQSSDTYYLNLTLSYNYTF